MTHQIANIVPFIIEINFFFAKSQFLCVISYNLYINTINSTKKTGNITLIISKISLNYCK